MAKVFNSFEKVAIKNAAKAIAAIQTKQEKLRKSIELFEAKVNAEIAAYDEEIKVFEDSVKGITGGYSPTELCKKETRVDGKQSDWVFVYPNTIVPPAEETAAKVAPLPIAETVIENDEPLEFEDENPNSEWVEEPAGDPMDDIFND